MLYFSFCGDDDDGDGMVQHFGADVEHDDDGVLYNGMISTYFVDALVVRPLCYCYRLGSSVDIRYWILAAVAGVGLPIVFHFHPHFVYQRRLFRASERARYLLQVLLHFVAAFCD